MGDSEYIRITLLRPCVYELSNDNYVTIILIMNYLELYNEGIMYCILITLMIVMWIYIITVCH